MHLNEPVKPFIINEDGSVTKIAPKSAGKNNVSHFLPVNSLRFWVGKRNMFICIFSALLMIGINSFCVYSFTEFIQHWRWAREARAEYFELREKGDAYEAERYHYRDLDNSRERNKWLGRFVVSFIASMTLDIAVVRMQRNKSKKKALKGIDYIQANPNGNNGYPFIMTQNKLGVFSAGRYRVIIPPEYDNIYWVVPKLVLCAVKDNQKYFFDTKGNLLPDVPQSYYSVDPL